MNPPKPRVVIALNLAWNLINFRAGLIRALVDAGYQVIAVAPYDDYADELSGLGCSYIAMPMDNQGTNPVKDLALTWRFYQLFKRLRPAVYLGYTVKPNVYGSLAARAAGVPIINNIAGLGAVFIRKSPVTTLVRGLYRLALGHSGRVFFQNGDDLKLFVDGGLVKQAITGRVPGSGISLSRFVPCPLPNSEPGKVRFLLIARMLWDKGVAEYVDAARTLRKKYPNAEFCLLGFLDVQNPAAISTGQMNDWVAEGVVTYLGVSDDVREQIAEVDCVVLPSYREGTPRSLLEGAAMARPLVATNAVGCKEVVEDGVTGYLCELKSASDLAAKMEQIINMEPAKRTDMGLQARAKVEREFDEQLVVSAYLKAVSELIRRKESTE
jgi:glycosyltransferase involved in cell wall biosynthesis